jgi:predicted HicB family RNase H-like nuclease
MQNTMRFKGYHGSVEISPEDNIIFGKVLFISPLINYESETAKGLNIAFCEAVESYLSDCKEQGIDPENL